MSRSVQFSLGLQTDKPAGRYADLAVLAEDLGFDGISVFGDLLFQPPLGPLLEMARVTRRLRLGAACWNPYTMHPYELAGQYLALHEASGGRCYLGLARGTWLGEIGVDQPRPITALAEAVSVIHALTTGDRAGVDGEIFHLGSGVGLRYPTLTQPPVLLIGTWGTRMAQLAGRIADEVKVGGTANPAMVPVIRSRIAPGIEAAGRPDGAVRVAIGAVTVVDANRRAARRRARTEVAMYLAVVAALDPTADVPADLIAAVSACVADGRYEAAGRLIPNDVLDLFAFAGDPEDVAAHAQSFIDAGVDRVEFGTPHGLTDESGIRLLGTEVLPALRP